MLKKKLKGWLKIVFLKNLREMEKYIAIIIGYLDKKRLENVKTKFQSVGYNLQFKGDDTYISSPEHLIIGNNVHLGKRLYVKSEGGLVIGHNTFISDEVKINTVDNILSNSKYKSVLIANNVRIGMGVTIGPGVKIGEGARIGAGSNIIEDVGEGEYINVPKDRVSKVNTITKNFYPTYTELPSEKLFFVLSTGRCGSKSIAANLNKHYDIYASHEEIHQFIRLSTELAHREKDVKTVKEEVENIFRYKTFKNPSGYKSVIHSDQRLWNMVPILKGLFPKCKFLHLIRNGRDTVRSMYARNLFADNDYELNQHQWAEFRLNGYMVGDVKKEVWKRWNSFEKCCWYWSYINENIHMSIKEEQSYLIRLEDIKHNLNDLLFFLDVPKINLGFEKYNSVKSKNKNKYNFVWSELEEQIFKDIAGETENKFYPSS